MWINEFVSFHWSDFTFFIFKNKKCIIADLNYKQGLFYSKSDVCIMYATLVFKNDFKLTLRSGDTLTNDRLERWCYC